MKTAAAFGVFSLVFGVLYGVWFSSEYQTIDTSVGLVTLFAVLGITTSALLYFLGKGIMWCLSKKT